MLAPGRLLLISIRAINWADWRLPSLRVTQITFMPRHSLLSPTAMAAAEVRRAARLGLGLRLTGAQVGLSWTVLRVARSETAGAAPAIIHRTGTRKESWWIQMIRSASFSTLSTCGSQRARERRGTILPAVIPTPARLGLCTWISTLLPFYLARPASS